MGWNLEIKADKPFDDKHVAAAVSKISGRDMTKFPWRQEWGWSAECDIWNPKGKTLDISGAWFSYKSAESFSERLADELHKFGYKLKVGSPDG